MTALEYLKYYQENVNSEAKFITKDDDGYVAIWKLRPTYNDEYYEGECGLFITSYLFGTRNIELEWNDTTIYSVEDIEERLPKSSSIEITPKQTWIKNRINEYDMVIKNHIEQGLIIPFELIQERNELFSQL